MRPEAVDFLDDVAGDLVQVLAVEGRAGLGRHVDGLHHGAGGRVQRVQFLADGDPYALAVVGNAVHLADAGEGTVFTDDVCGFGFHVDVLFKRLTCPS